MHSFFISFQSFLEQKDPVKKKKIVTQIFLRSLFANSVTLIFFWK